MSLLEVASIAAGLVVGFLLVSAFTRNDELGDWGEDNSRDNSSDGPDSVGTTEDASWHVVLGVSEFATDSEILSAKRIKIAQYHPDKVATLGEEIRELAERKSRQINAAFDEAMRRR